MTDDVKSGFRRAGVIGWPIGHSRSPLIHGFWLDAYRIDGAYDRYGVPPERIDGFLATLADHGLIGANVTIPHKEAAFRASADVDDAAAALRAVNTLWLEDGRLIGANTDAYGFLANLDQNAPGWDRNPGPAIVLGAGGAARAIVWALLDRGFAPVLIVNRTHERACRLADYFGSKTVARAWRDLAASLAGARLLVNTTSLGMTGYPPLQIDLGALPGDALVSDIIYAPLKTGLIAEAEARGLPTVDGLGMLLHQAVPGFARWFGVRPEVTAELRHMIVEDLTGAA